jgi:hypothetical protein
MRPTIALALLTALALAACDSADPGVDRQFVDAGAQSPDATPAPPAPVPDAAPPGPDARIPPTPDASPAGDARGTPTPDASPQADAAAPPTPDAVPAPEADAGSIGPCNREGGRVCGGNGVEGDPQVLYTCRNGERVPVERCATTCDSMPRGVPDRCVQPIEDIPAELIDALDATPYVEGDCVDVDHPGWPYAAQRCDYSAGPLSTTVVVANPAPRRVARWLIDAAGVMPVFDRLRETNRDTWVAGLAIMARQVMNQSSRIFPLEGGIIENMGDGYIDYPFLHGVTDGCSTGCYCRINSLHRTEYCSYQAGMDRETEDTCLARVGERALTEAWGEVCQGNHERSWDSDVNEHFRARAWMARGPVYAACPDACDAQTLLDALRQTYQ